MRDWQTGPDSQDFQVGQSRDLLDQVFKNDRQDLKVAIPAQMFSHWQEANIQVFKAVTVPGKKSYGCRGNKRLRDTVDAAESLAWFISSLVWW